MSIVEAKSSRNVTDRGVEVLKSTKCLKFRVGEMRPILMFLHDVGQKNSQKCTPDAYPTDEIASAGFETEAFAHVTVNPDVENTSLDPARELNGCNLAHDRFRIAFDLLRRFTC